MKAQITKSGDILPALPKEGKKFIQEVIGTFLYYAQCVDSTMLTALGSLATQQANPTKNIKAKATQFLDYAATHPNAIFTYHTNNMVLAGHVNDNVLKKLKSMGMKYHWLRNRFFCRKFRHYGASGKVNNGNYLTNYHVPIHHHATCPTFLTPLTVVQTLRNWLLSLLPAARVC